MPTPPQEQVLIDLWRHGDQDAARQIVERYFDRLLVLARRRISQRLASRVDPEDIVQSVFRTFFVRLKDGQFVFEDEDDLCKLLMRITLHKTLRQVAFHKAAKRDPNLETNQGDDHREQLLTLLDREPSPRPRSRSSTSWNTSSTNLSRRRAGSSKCASRDSNDEIARELGVIRPQDPPGRGARPRPGARGGPGRRGRAACGVMRCPPGRLDSHMRR